MPQHDSAFPRATVIVPAYNEEAVIARSLGRLAQAARTGEFEFVVICNACHDRTAEIVSATVPEANVIETPVAGKTNALNLGHAVSRAPVRIYLDADLDVDTEDLRALIRPIEQGQAEAACGRMEVDVSNCRPTVQAFYRVWALNPYLARGKFGGLFALSARAASRLHPIPPVTADDEFARRSVPADEIAVVDECAFTMHAPRTLADLLKIRRRSLRGARELERRGMTVECKTGARSGLEILRQLAGRPSLWVQAVIYYAISVYVRLAVSLERPGRAPRWERDESSRIAA